MSDAPVAARVGRRARARGRAPARRLRRGAPDARGAHRARDAAADARTYDELEQLVRATCRTQRSCAVRVRRRADALPVLALRLDGARGPHPRAPARALRELVRQHRSRPAPGDARRRRDHDLAFGAFGALDVYVRKASRSTSAASRSWARARARRRSARRVPARRSCASSRFRSGRGSTSGASRRVGAAEAAPGDQGHTEGRAAGKQLGA